MVIGRRLLFVLGMSALSVALCPSFASSHDLKGMIRTEVMDQPLETIRKPNGDLIGRGVIANLYKWPSHRKLTICFIGGTRSLRSKIAAAMQRQWHLHQLTRGNLDYNAASFSDLADCGAAASPNYDIRVGFLHGAYGGYWSYIGVDSRNHVPSMNFEGFDSNAPAEPDFDRLVAHEFGHALSLEHEHQSPMVPPCDWNYDYIYTHYSWQSPADMHANLDKLKNYVYNGKYLYSYTTYNKKSIMHYYFAPLAFVKGRNSKCYILQNNNVPSEEDKTFITQQYAPATFGGFRGLDTSLEDLSRIPNARLQQVIATKRQLLRDAER